MKGIAGNQTKGLQNGSRLTVIDNTGAKEIEIITVPGYHGVARRVPSAGLGDIVIASVKKGTPQMRRQIVFAVIVRQRRPTRRPDGTMVYFEDNAAVITTETGETKGTDIKGPVAREAAERWPRVSATASMIVRGASMVNKKASSKARVQRRNRAHAPAHVRSRMLSAHLSTELRAKYGVRSVRLCKGDTVVVVRGNEDLKNIEGKVLNVYTKTGRVAIDGITIKQADGTDTERPIHASNLVIVKLNTEDPWRMDSLAKRGKGVSE